MSLYRKGYFRCQSSDFSYLIHSYPINTKLYKFYYTFRALS